MRMSRGKYCTFYYEYLVKATSRIPCITPKEQETEIAIIWLIVEILGQKIEMGKRKGCTSVDKSKTQTQSANSIGKCTWQVEVPNKIKKFTTDSYISASSHKTVVQSLKRQRTQMNVRNATYNLVWQSTQYLRISIKS